MASTTVVTGNGPREMQSSDLSARQTPFEEIPLIDFSAMHGTDLAAKAEVGSQIRNACTQIGFFYATGHQVPQPTIESTFTAAHRFFDLPMAQKENVAIENSEALRGYTRLLGENTNPENHGDMHEGFDIALDLSADDPDVRQGIFGYSPNQWPDELDDFREPLVAYHNALRVFSAKVFEAFALALDLPIEYFDQKITKPMAHMRVLHYPSQEARTLDEKQIGIGAHSDYECFTILCTDDVPALQVLNSAGQWIAAPPVSGAFIVNVGDLMARWTNDYFQSTIHRAINTSGRERFSIPFFFGTNPLERIEVLPSCQSADNPPRYSPMTAADYIKSRFDDTYAHRSEKSV